MAEQSLKGKVNTTKKANPFCPQAPNYIGNQWKGKGRVLPRESKGQSWLKSIFNQSLSLESHSQGCVSPWLASWMCPKYCFGPRHGPRSGRTSSQQRRFNRRSLEHQRKPLKGIWEIRPLLLYFVSWTWGKRLFSDTCTSYDMVIPGPKAMRTNWWLCTGASNTVKPQKMISPYKLSILSVL